MEIDEFIGCTHGYFRDWLEGQFTPETTWENRGTYWPVDHVIPCAAYDMSDIEQAKLCTNRQNLRPLEASKNLAKEAKITCPQQHLRRSYYCIRIIDTNASE